MNRQKYSTFHDAGEMRLKAWHGPYVQLFKGFSPVLDVGCGPGYFQELLRDAAIDSTGIDIDPEMVALAVQRGNTAMVGNQNTVAEFRNRFMGVHVSHVVEHLWGDELISLLANSAAALQDGGLLIIRTPNWGNKKVREFLFWMDHTHKRPYPAELLARLVEDVGLRVVSHGAEPNGVEDVYFIAQKPDPSGKLNAAPSCRPVWPGHDGRRSITEKIRFRVRRWLDGPEAW